MLGEAVVHPHPRQLRALRLRQLVQRRDARRRPRGLAEAGLGIRAALALLVLLLARRRRDERQAGDEQVAELHLLWLCAVVLLCCTVAQRAELDRCAERSSANRRPKATITRRILLVLVPVGVIGMI